MGFGKFFGKIFGGGEGAQLPHNNPDIPDHIAVQIGLAKGHMPFDQHRRDALMYLQFNNGNF